MKTVVNSKRMSHTQCIELFCIELIERIFTVKICILVSSVCCFGSCSSAVSVLIFIIRCLLFLLLLLFLFFLRLFFVVVVIVVRGRGAFGGKMIYPSAY